MLFVLMLAFLVKARLPYFHLYFHFKTVPRFLFTKYFDRAAQYKREEMTVKYTRQLKLLFRRDAFHAVAARASVFLLQSL